MTLIPQPPPATPRRTGPTHCTGGRRCTLHCPQHTDILKEIERIDRFVESLKQEKAVEKREDA